MLPNKYIPAKTPWLAKLLLPNYVWQVQTNKKEIYLTFDDGPTPTITNWVLDVLQQYQAKATFFCIGKNVSENPDIYKQILAAGHHIGNHTQNHIKGWKTKTTTYIENVEIAQQNLKVNYKLFRPPYGQITNKQGKTLINLGYKIIMWNVLTFDWDTNTKPEKCLNHVINNTKPGSIVVFHDSLKASKNLQYALPKVLKYYSDKGFQFKSL